MVTDYMNNCLLCGRPRTDIHHCIYGSNRKKCDADAIVIPLCRECHSEIHHNGVSGHLSKVLGQALWELNEVADEKEIRDAREKFRKRYGNSFL